MRFSGGKRRYFGNTFSPAARSERILNRPTPTNDRIYTADNSPYSTLSPGSIFRVRMKTARGDVGRRSTSSRRRLLFAPTKVTCVASFSNTPSPHADRGLRENPGRTNEGGVKERCQGRRGASRSRVWVRRQREPMVGHGRCCRPEKHNDTRVGKRVFFGISLRTTVVNGASPLRFTHGVYSFCGFPVGHIKQVLPVNVGGNPVIAGAHAFQFEIARARNGRRPRSPPAVGERA